MLTWQQSYFFLPHTEELSTIGARYVSKSLNQYLNLYAVHCLNKEKYNVSHVSHPYNRYKFKELFSWKH